MRIKLKRRRFFHRSSLRGASRAERLADNIVPFSFIGFGLTLLFTRNITKAVSILMVDYSCAIKLSTPISVISALREAADRNMTVKGGKYLEEFALADTIVFDKTGTLTKAEPKLERVIPFGNRSEEEILRIAACIEAPSIRASSYRNSPGNQLRLQSYQHQFADNNVFFLPCPKYNQLHGNPVSKMPNNHCRFDLKPYSIR